MDDKQYVSAYSSNQTNYGADFNKLPPLAYTPQGQPKTVAGNLPPPPPYPGTGNSQVAPAGFTTCGNGNPNSQFQDPNHAPVTTGPLCTCCYTEGTSRCLLMIFFWMGFAGIIAFPICYALVFDPFIKASELLEGNCTITKTYFTNEWFSCSCGNRCR